MHTVSIHEAKTHLSRLLKQVKAGEEVIITHSGTPVAKLSAVSERHINHDRDATLRNLLAQADTLADINSDFNESSLYDDQGLPQ